MISGVGLRASELLTHCRATPHTAALPKARLVEEPFRISPGLIVLPGVAVMLRHRTYTVFLQRQRNLNKYLGQESAE
jgi:hypothetical protein